MNNAAPRPTSSSGSRGEATLEIAQLKEEIMFEIRKEIKAMKDEILAAIANR